MQTETQKPQNNKNNENRPKHVNLLCSLKSKRMGKETTNGGLCAHLHAQRRLMPNNREG
jgi:hypothetical protein